MQKRLKDDIDVSQSVVVHLVCVCLPCPDESDVPTSLSLATLSLSARRAHTVRVHEVCTYELYYEY